MTILSLFLSFLLSASASLKSAHHKREHGIDGPDNNSTRHQNMNGETAEPDEDWVPVNKHAQKCFKV